MTAVAFDTLQLAKRLEAAGFPTKQAQDTAEAIAGAVVETVATRSDLRSVELELSAKLEQVRLEGAQHRAELEARLAETKADLLRWMFGAVGLQTLAILGGVVAVVRMAIP
jgi:cell division septum initiation protein DivIVA